MKLKIIPWLKSFQFHIVGKLLTLATFILSLHRFHLNEVSILQSSSNKSNHKKFLAQHNTSFYLSNRSESCTFLPVPICFDLYYIELPGRPKLPPDIHHHRVSVLLLYRPNISGWSHKNIWCGSEYKNFESSVRHTLECESILYRAPCSRSEISEKWLAGPFLNTGKKLEKMLICDNSSPWGKTKWAMQKRATFAPIK